MEYEFGYWYVLLALFILPGFYFLYRFYTKTKKSNSLKVLVEIISFSYQKYVNKTLHGMKIYQLKRLFSLFCHKQTLTFDFDTFEILSTLIFFRYDSHSSQISILKIFMEFNSIQKKVM